MYHIGWRLVMADKARRTRSERPERRQAQPVGTVRKNFNLPQSAIDRARDALGTSTETETVLRALETAADLVDFRRSTDSVLAELVGDGGFVDRFASADEAA
jgi:hypothetical protein